MELGVTTEFVAQRWPTLFHMAAPHSWPSIRVHGLLSTEALLDLFEVDGAAREKVLAEHRPENVELVHPVHGRAIVRDQKPMDDRGLQRCLRDGLTPQDWYRTLNEKVFFWLTERRLHTLLAARAYRGRAHTILEVDTKTLLDRHHERVLLSPMNSGCTKPWPHPRGAGTFAPFSTYPFAERQRINRSDPIVELSVKYAVADIAECVIKVLEVDAEDRDGKRKPRTIWERSAK